MPTIDAWLQAAIASAERYGHAGTRPILEALAAAVTALRSAPWNADAADGGDAATREARPDPKQ
jgi:hypothetical protein